MKKYFSIALAALAASALILSCSKEEAPAVNDPVNPDSGEVTPPSNVITITATLSDATTKVSFTPGVSSGDPILSLTWQASDKLRVADHADNSSYSDFDLVSGQDTNSATFSGTPVSASAYDVWVVHSGASLGSQTQAADGDASHLEYIAMAENVASGDLASVVLDQVSSVLLFTAKNMPAGVAAVIKSVDITAINSDGSPANIFAGDDELSITLTTKGDAGSDNTLMLYATLPVGDQAIAAGTSLLVKFNAPGEDHDVYTRYFTIPSAKTLTHGKLNEFEIGCSNIASHAGAATCDGSEAAKAYLIADPYQVAAINSLATAGETTYFKMIADVDMSGVTHVPVNPSDPYNQLVSFDGNDKTISNLGKNLFYVFKGSIKDLTLDKSSISSRGALAEYIQGSGNTITNVTVKDGTVNSSSNNVGGLIGQINTGSSGLITATITDCTVSGTNVTGAGVVGGLVGFANELVMISGCKYTGGTVHSTGRYCGGLLGSTANVESVISDCQVENATVSTAYKNDARCGGFVGQLQTSCQVKGCTVGTIEKKVTVSTVQPESGKVLNTGGFVGVNYGTITKNGDVRSKAYATITSTNTLGQQLNLGGFVGFGRGTIEYSDATVDMTSLKGQYIGGFAGYVINAGTVISNCTIDGAVTGNNYTGGFAGYVDSGAPVISDCTASGSVTAQSGCGGFVGQSMTGVLSNCSTSMICSFSGSNNGGFVGQIHGGTMTGCSASGSVTSSSTGTTFGGFAGLIHNSTTLDKCSASGNVSSNSKSYFGAFLASIDNGETILIKRCHATGNVTSNQTYASAFIANINQGTSMTLGSVTIENCYATGDIINSNQIRGGFIAQIGTVASATISNCYASGAVVGSFRLGGLIGNVSNANATIENCAAWNSEVTAGTYGQTNWSSGAIVGTIHPNCHASNNFRKPGMPLTVYCPPPSADWDHPDIDGTTHPLYMNSQTAPFTWAETTATSISAGTGNADAGRWAYHGKHVDTGTFSNLSALASTAKAIGGLGWSDDIWDFSGPLPLLK